MSASPCFPKGLIALATCLAFVNAALGATVDSGRDQPSVRRDQCIDQEGNPINSGFCNKSLVISLAVVLCTLFLTAVAVAMFLRSRRKKTNTKMMSELGIGSKQTPLGERRPAKVVRVKLPGLSVSIPSGKVSGELAQSPDSVVAPTPHRVAQ